MKKGYMMAMIMATTTRKKFFPQLAACLAYFKASWLGVTHDMCLMFQFLLNFFLFSFSGVYAGLSEHMYIFIHSYRHTYILP